MESDVIIVGAGAAGLMAARELARSGKTITVLEARERFGGRIQTIQDATFPQPVETGAEFVHGNLELTLQLLQEAGLKKDIAEGEVWRNKNGHLLKQDNFIEHGDVLLQVLQQQERESSIGHFLETHFSNAQYVGLKKSVQDYVEGYYAGTLQKASTLALKEEWQREEEPQYRVVEGYTKLMQTLYDACVKSGCAFRFSAPVKQVTWAFEKVAVTTANGDMYKAKKIIMAVPLPVLTSMEAAGSIAFYPALSKQKEAFKNLGSGSVIKILIQFETAFWRKEFSMNHLHFLFSDEAVPTWWTQHPRPATLLTGWCAGPHADALKEKSDAQLFQKSIQSLSRIFCMALRDVEKKITAWRICNWAADPFTLGGYSYITTTTKEALQIVTESVEQTIYFAGEAFYDDINVGTVEAALQSGRQTAQRVSASFS